MNNDLISREALLKKMSVFCRDQRYLISENIWDMVKNIPCAYDIDKLEEERKKAKKYIDLELQLKEVYGECEGFLEEAVKYLVRHTGVDIGNPGKSMLITDEEVNTYQRWKELNKQGKLLELSTKLQAVNGTYNNFREVILQDILKEMEEMKFIWSGLEKPPYNEFEQELYLSGLRKAIDIILEASNAERSAKNCGGWIPCNEQLPKDGVDVLVWFEYFRYGEYNRLFQTTGISYTFNGKWSGFVNGNSGWNQLNIIAWQPLPEPYHES
ncbi:MAG TPA: hypothetical protein DDY31_10825 [Lachnospiraceae bacterium]|nr:hypothetical protein [Lachnospiraceae bacterium]